MGPTAIFGVASEYAWEVVETLRRCGAEVVCIDNLGTADQELPGLRRELEGHPGGVVLGPGSPRPRLATAVAAVTAGVRAMNPLVDPSAVVAGTAELAHGVYVNALACVGAKAHLGCLVNINRTTSIGHHCELGAFTCTGPGAVLCGSVRTGAGVFVGAGATVLPGLEIGAGATVGAGAVVTKDVPPGAVVVGNPARIVRESVNWTESLSCPLC